MKARLVTIATVLLVGLIAGSAHAQSDIGFKGIGGRLGYVSPNDVDGTIGLGAIADLGQITPKFGFEATIDFWSSSTGPASFEIKARDIVFGARGKYPFEVKDNPKLKPYAAAGLAFHFVKIEVPAVTIGTIGTFGGVDDSSTKLGIDLAGGVGYEAGEKFDIVGEIMYRAVSDVGQWLISGGVVFWLGGGETPAATP